VASAATGRIDPSALLDLVERAQTAAAVTPVDPGWPGLADPAPVPAEAGAERVDPATGEAPPDVRAALVADFVAAGTGTDAAGYCDTSGAVRAFVNNAGQRLSGETTSAIIDGIHRLDGRAGSGHRSAPRVSDLDGVTAGREAIERLGGRVAAVEMPPGEHEVVLGPKAVAELVGFLAFYGFNAKVHEEGQSFVVLGEQQLDPSITVWDDAADPRMTGFLFDAEGTPKQRLELVAGGVSRALTHDRRTAAKAGTNSTGHAVGGAMGSYGPTAQNLFLVAGTHSQDELIAGVERGLLVTEFNYCRILDPKTHVVTGLTRNGTFLIEGGRVAAPAEDLRFTQSFAGSLAPGQVLGIGADTALVEATTFVPSLRLASWHFSGGARG
jgi:predicted Zn-dependent protease